MKCPNCGEEINTVLERGNRLKAYEAEYHEEANGVFEFWSEELGDTVDTNVTEVVCPKCQKSLKYFLDKGKLVITGGKSS